MIRAFSAEETLARAGQLAEVLLDCIAGRASVSFMEDFSRDEATEYWRAIAADVRAGRRVLFAAGEVDGTAQLLLQVPPNQPHRAELAKMLVHRRVRRRGVGRALFAAVEEEARRRGKTLLTFDTMAGGDAERLYIACGCTKVGEIPGYALFPRKLAWRRGTRFHRIRRKRRSYVRVAGDGDRIRADGHASALLRGGSVADPRAGASVISGERVQKLWPWLAAKY